MIWVRTRELAARILSWIKAYFVNKYESGSTDNGLTILIYNYKRIIEFYVYIKLTKWK